MADEIRAFLAEHDAVLKRSPRHSTTVPEPSRGSIPACAGKPPIPACRAVSRSWRSAGSIPACAGKPATPWSTWVCRRVYPRVCGEARNPCRAFCAALGLSPRVRGSRYRGRPSPPGPRSIPACAGKPPSPSWTGRGATVYPRGCGEAGTNLAIHIIRSGLSPRVRGSQADVDDRISCERSIPASPILVMSPRGLCAGKPNCSPR